MQTLNTYLRRDSHIDKDFCYCCKPVGKFIPGQGFPLTHYILLGEDSCILIDLGIFKHHVGEGLVFGKELFKGFVPVYVRVLPDWQMGCRFVHELSPFNYNIVLIIL